MYKNAEDLTPEGNPVAIVEQNNLSLLYSTYSYAVDRVNGKMYAITVGGWHLIPEKVSLTPFSSVTLEAGCKISLAQFCDSAVKVGDVVDMSPAAESTRAPIVV